MSYSKRLRQLFPGLSLQAEDLLFLEAFQVKYLPERVAPKEFAILLHAYPVVHRYLLAREPSIESFLTEILQASDPEPNKKRMEEQCQEALWEIADLIIYNKYPDRFDTNAPIKWRPDEINSITSLKGKVIADVGAGSGRIAFMVAPLSQTVFAVEPVASLRSFMKEKSEKNHIGNLFVMDGTLDSIPLPDQSLDILITSNAIGWKLQEELKEIERVVKPGGHAMHLLWSEEKHENPFHDPLTSDPWNYSCLGNKDSLPMKLIYTKVI